MGVNTLYVQHSRSLQKRERERKNAAVFGLLSTRVVTATAADALVSN